MVPRPRGSRFERRRSAGQIGRAIARDVALIGIWPALGALYLGLRAGDARRAGLPGGSSLALLVLWVEWGFLTPLLVGWAQRHAPFGRDAPRVLSTHVLTLFVIVSTLFLANGLVRGAIIGVPMAQLVLRFQTALSLGFSIYFGTAVVTWLVTLNSTAAQGRTRAAGLRELVAGQELAAFRMQLSPTLIVRAMGRIDATMEHDSAAAEDAIYKLTRMMRDVLDYGREDSVPLIQEVHAFERHLAVLALVGGRPIAVSRDIPIDELRTPIPSNLLRFVGGELAPADGAEVRVIVRRRGPTVIICLDTHGFVKPADGRRSQADVIASVSNCVIDLSSAPERIMIRVAAEPG